MGRTVPSFRIVIAQEKKEWKLFRNGLDKSERKEFDEMWNIPSNYVSACSNSVQLVPLHPIITSILFHHYKELKECISEVEQIETRVNNKLRRLIVKEENAENVKKSIRKDEETRDSLSSYFLSTFTLSLYRFPVFLLWYPFP